VRGKNIFICLGRIRRAKGAELAEESGEATKAKRALDQIAIPGKSTTAIREENKIDLRRSLRKTTTTISGYKGKNVGRVEVKKAE